MAPAFSWAQHVVEGVGRSERTPIHTLGTRGLGGQGTASVAFSRMELSLTSDRDDGLVFWSVQTGQSVRTFKPKLSTPAVSPDATRARRKGSNISSCGMLQAAGSPHLRRTRQWRCIVASSPDGTRLLTVTARVRLWDAAAAG
jgi:WD40 repeat protein